MDSTQKAIKDKIDSFPIEQAREFVTTLPATPGSINRHFAESCLEVKEKALRDSKETESLSISRKALFISKIAIILSIATAIGIAIFQWLTKN